MLLIHQILGHADAAHFAGRRADTVPVHAADAGRRRLRRRSAGGEDVAIDLPRPAWLFHGAVLHDDGQRILVVERPEEPVMVIELASLAPQDAFRLGHALGNRHSPSDWQSGEVVVPVTDTPELTARPVRSLGLPGLVLRFEARRFAAAAAPTCLGAAHVHAPGAPGNAGLAEHPHPHAHAHPDAHAEGHAHGPGDDHAH